MFPSFEKAIKSRCRWFWQTLQSCAFRNVIQWLQYVEVATIWRRIGRKPTSADEYKAVTPRHQKRGLETGVPFASSTPTHGWRGKGDFETTLPQTWRKVKGQETLHIWSKTRSLFFTARDLDPIKWYENGTGNSGKISGHTLVHALHLLRKFWPHLFMHLQHPCVLVTLFKHLPHPCNFTHR